MKNRQRWMVQVVGASAIAWATCAAADEWVRIPMAHGIELLVSDDMPLPSPKQLVDIAMQIRKLFRQK